MPTSWERNKRRLPKRKRPPSPQEHTQMYTPNSQHRQNFIDPLCSFFFDQLTHFFSFLRIPDCTVTIRQFLLFVSWMFCLFVRCILCYLMIVCTCLYMYCNKILSGIKLLEGSEVNNAHPVLALSSIEWSIVRYSADSEEAMNRGRVVVQLTQSPFRKFVEGGNGPYWIRTVLYAIYFVWHFFFLFIAPLPLPTAWASPRPCVCTKSHARLLSSAPFAQKVHIPSLKYQRTGVRWVFKSHQCWFSTDGVPPGNQGGNNGLSMDGRPLCPRCGEPFSGTFSTMSKSCSLSLLSL